MRMFLAVLFCALATVAAQAQVVALGASNTRGYDLALSDAFPAKLEALLHAKGRNVTVANEGVNGDTSEGMLSRFDSAVPEGTRVVILECCGNDDKNGGHLVADHAGGIRALVGKARARKIAVVYIADSYRGSKDSSGVAAAKAAGARLCGGIMAGVPEEHKRPSSAGTHLDPEGYEIVAHRILGCVIGALGGR